ncbi:hypothetical protein AAFF_G00358970 [Aldrovandia affinis]|uniref:Uncharacterized protein n=1 Tax=Aldrovandia affinis TaxID=143900 RepID=A0AAD7SK57_9TELE|nr:hypothetical protein AAFF_G00358970 [Aldrovandia affinis]
MMKSSPAALPFLCADDDRGGMFGRVAERRSPRGGGSAGQEALGKCSHSRTLSEIGHGPPGSPPNKRLISFPCHSAPPDRGAAGWLRKALNGQAKL